MKKMYEDYTDNKVKVFICSPSFREIPRYFDQINYDFAYTFKTDGIIIETAIQMIPEVIDILVGGNIAIYEVIRLI